MFGMGVRERHVREKGDKEGCSRYGEKERGEGTFQGGSRGVRLFTRRPNRGVEKVKNTHIL